MDAPFLDTPPILQGAKVFGFQLKSSKRTVGPKIIEFFFGTNILLDSSIYPESMMSWGQEILMAIMYVEE